MVAKLSARFRGPALLPPGSGNQGHDYWYRIWTDANRRALIEYLKTL